MRNLLSVRRVLTAAACVMCLSLCAPAQESEESNSLGDIARQSRAQHAATPEGNSNRAQGLVDEMQRGKGAEDRAPTGFTNFDAGDYRVFVPYPFSLEGRANGGAVLGSRLGATITEVLVGAPLPIPANLSDTDLKDTTRQLAQMYAQSANCSPIKLGARQAFRCRLSKALLLERAVTGSMEFVVGADSLIPVMCVSAENMQQCGAQSAADSQTCGKIHSSGKGRKTKAAKPLLRQDQQSNAQVCEQIIYPSIQLKEDIVVHPVSIPGPGSHSAGAVAADESSAGEAGSQGASLAELARQTRQTQPDAQVGPAQTTVDGEGTTAAPEGFHSIVLQYCQNPQQCSEASLVVPEKAEVVSRTNGQHIFKATLDGEPVMLYAGPADVNAPYRSLTDRDYIRMRDLANSNGWSREKPDSVSLQELTIEGRAALMTRFRYQRDQKRWWIGERVLIENHGAQFLLGCTAPEEHFADAEVLCTTLVNSLRLP